MNFKTGKIRKNAKIMIDKLLDMSTKITQETHSMWIDDSMRSNGSHKTSAKVVRQWMEDNYRDMKVYLTCDPEGKPESLRIGGQYHWSDEFTITFKMVIRAFTEEYYQWLSYKEPVEQEQSNEVLTQEAELNVSTKDSNIIDIQQSVTYESEIERETTVVEFKKPGSSFISYMKKLIEEKGGSLDDEIVIDGHFGFTYQMLVEQMARYKDVSKRIKNMLVAIDFKNGDIFQFLDGLAVSYVKEEVNIH
jgi:hypothetical protein